MAGGLEAIGAVYFDFAGASFCKKSVIGRFSLQTRQLFCLVSQAPHTQEGATTLLKGMRKFNNLKAGQRPRKSLIVTGLVQKGDDFVFKAVLLKGKH